MRKLLFFLLPAFSIQLTVSAQQPQEDSVKILQQIIVSAFEQHRAILLSPISVSRIEPSGADRYNKNSLLDGLNAIAGVRMEERSPGSYRINIRGSSLRSPFGVRNVKVYWNDIPVTDPGGNTYFNQFAFNNFSSIEVYNGPVSSMYGAGTGGLILMNSLDYSRRTPLSLEYVTGSYDLQNIFVSGQFGQKQNNSVITYAHNRSDGYRDHTSMRRDNASFVSKSRLSEKEELTGSILFTDLYYETPGGLTKAEFDANPALSKPAAGGLPSAVQSKAAIFQKNFLAGINHTYDFSSSFKNSTSLYGAFAQIKNPTFRNYERRNEPHFGGRTTFTYERSFSGTKLQLVGGSEVQQAYFNTQVSKNKQGSQDSLQTDDDIRYNNYNVFFQADADIVDKWILTAGLSLNRSSVQFTRLNKYPVVNQTRTYNSEWSPRFELLHKLGANASIYANITKGFSPPTIAELLPSTSTISTFLEAEEGTNYEAGGKLYLLSGDLYLQAAAFYFKLNNALVVRKDSSNADYYVNAGNTQQKGIEANAHYGKSLANNSDIFKYFVTNLALTYNDFTYGDFKKGASDFTGKSIPGVPQQTLSLLADLQFKNGIYINSTWYYSSSIYLSDDNTAKADPYNLLGLRAGWRAGLHKVGLNIYTGVDNLLDKSYSLGNDINAAGGRYYNAAPKRNWYAGISFQFLGKRGE